MLYLVSLRGQQTIFSLAQLYRSCTEKSDLHEETVMAERSLFSVGRERIPTSIKRSDALRIRGVGTRKTVENLILDLLQWLGLNEGTYQEAIPQG